MYIYTIYSILFLEMYIYTFPYILCAQKKYRKYKSIYILPALKMNKCTFRTIIFEIKTEPEKCLASSSGWSNNIAI